MTLPDERYRAVIWAGRFLREISYNTVKYPRVPKKVRQEAYSILRHFPNPYDIKHAAESCPEVFQERMDPLHRLIMLHEQEKKDEGGLEL